MAEISKFISKDIGDLNKIFGVDKANLSTVINIDIPAAWTSHFDNNDWQVQDNATWDGSKWVESGPGMVLNVKSDATWEEGYRPTQIRVTGAFNYVDWITLYDGTSGNVIARGATQNPITTLSIDWQHGLDMVRLDLYGYSNVTNIEFM